MLFWKITVFTCIISQWFSIEATNYCYLPCGDVNHTSCESCGKQEECMDVLYAEYHPDKFSKYKILQAHNRVRNNLAAGINALGGYFKLSIAQMNYMNYDNELENLAFCWLRKCKMSPDPCCRTFEYPNVKQNIFLISRHNCRYSSNIVRAIGHWHNELRVSREISRKCSEAYVGNEKNDSSCVLAFGQILYGNNSLVGCGMIRHPNCSQCFLACNYAPGYLTNFSVYDKGPPASFCKNVDSRYPYLCRSDSISIIILRYFRNWLLFTIILCVM